MGCIFPIELSIIQVHMAGLLIIAHAPLASALKLAAQHCFPDAAQALQALDVPPHVSPEEVLAQARLLLTLVQEGDALGEALVLTDVFGATPCNAVQGLADGVRVKVITGVNVPMLWRTLNYASQPLDTLTNLAMAGGTHGVMQIATSRPQNQVSQPSHDQDQRHHQQ
jgi:PTS system mannose-specific IIA component